MNSLSLSLSSVALIPMAQESSPPVSIVINVEVGVFTIERILILLIPYARSTTGLGFIITNFLAALTSISSPPSGGESSVFDCLFWVERVACVLLWWSFVEGIHGRCWYVAVFLFNFSNMALLVCNGSFIQRRFQLRPSPSTRTIDSEIKLEKKQQVAELGTQTEVVDSPDEQHYKISEEAKETNEEGRDLGAASDDQNGCGINPEIDNDFDFKSMNFPPLVVDEINADTDLNIFLKLEIDDKKEIRSVKVEVDEEERYSSQYLKKVNLVYQAKLKETREAWENRLRDELKQFQAVACTWEEEKKELEGYLNARTVVCQNLQRGNEQERCVWEGQRKDLVKQIEKYKVERERFEGQIACLQSYVAGARLETVETKAAMEELEKIFNTRMVMTMNEIAVRARAVYEAKVSELMEEKIEMGRKLQEQEELTEKCKNRLQASMETGFKLEKENMLLAEMFETMVTTNDFNKTMKVLRIKCDDLEEENKVLDEKLVLATEMSEFYRNVIRNFDFRL